MPAGKRVLRDGSGNPKDFPQKSARNLKASIKHFCPGFGRLRLREQPFASHPSRRSHAMFKTARQFEIARKVSFSLALALLALPLAPAHADSPGGSAFLAQVRQATA